MTHRHRLGATGVAALAALIGATLAGCAVSPPTTGYQTAKFGLLITWDTTQPGNTVTAENALLVKCGLPVPTTPTPAGSGSTGEASSDVSVPSGKLPDTQATCLTTSVIVKMIDILSAPAPSPS